MPVPGDPIHDGLVHLDDVPRELLAVVALVALAWALVLAGRGWVRGHHRRRRFARAAAGEREAVSLLEVHGFVIEGAQVAAEYALEVDGAPVVASVRADYIVRAGGRRWVAEVKTGRAAPSLATATTRRQLLEYQHAFGVAGVLLVDADARTVQCVDFRTPARRPVTALVFAAAVVAAIAAWIGHGMVDSGCRDAASFRMKGR